jgi:hypothetical protein
MGRKRPWIEEDTAIQILVGIGAAVILGAMTKFGVFDGDDPKNDRDDDRSGDFMAEMLENLQRLNADVGVHVHGNGQVIFNNFAGPPVPETPDSSDSESGTSTTETPDTSQSSGPYITIRTGTPATPEQERAFKYELAPMRVKPRANPWSGNVPYACQSTPPGRPLMSNAVVATVVGAPQDLRVYLAMRMRDQTLGQWVGYGAATRVSKGKNTTDFLFCVEWVDWDHAEELVFLAQVGGALTSEEWVEDGAEDWGSMYGNALLTDKWRECVVDRNMPITVLNNATGKKTGTRPLGSSIISENSFALTLSTK